MNEMGPEIGETYRAQAMFVFTAADGEAHLFSLPKTSIINDLNTDRISIPSSVCTTRPILWGLCQPINLPFLAVFMLETEGRSGSA